MRFDLLPVDQLIIPSDQADDCGINHKPFDGLGAVCCCTVVLKEGVQDWNARQPCGTPVLMVTAEEVMSPPRAYLVESSGSSCINYCLVQGP